jgi:hypothetical protein
VSEEPKTYEELQEQIARMQDRVALHNGKLAGLEKAFAKRLNSLRNAARLANIRADKAEKAMRAMAKAVAEIDKLSAEEPRP